MVSCFLSTGRGQVQHKQREHFEKRRALTGKSELPARKPTWTHSKVIRLLACLQVIVAQSSRSPWAQDEVTGDVSQDLLWIQRQKQPTKKNTPRHTRQQEAQSFARGHMSLSPPRGQFGDAPLGLSLSPHSDGMDSPGQIDVQYIIFT